MNRMKFVRPSDEIEGIWNLFEMKITTKKNNREGWPIGQAVRYMASRGYAPLNQFSKGLKKHISKRFTKEEGPWLL